MEAQGSQPGDNCLPAYLPQCVSMAWEEIRKPLSALASTWCRSNCTDCSLLRKGTYASLRQSKEDACGIQTGGAATMGMTQRVRRLEGGVLFLISSVPHFLKEWRCWWQCWLALTEGVSLHSCPQT